MDVTKNTASPSEAESSFKKLKYNTLENADDLFNFDNETYDSTPFYEEVSDDEEEEGSEEFEVEVTDKDLFEFNQGMAASQKENNEEDIENEETDHETTHQTNVDEDAYQKTLYELQREREKAHQLESAILQRENAYMQNLSVLENQIANSEMQRTADYEKYLVTEEKRVKDALYIAKTENDPQTEINLMDALTDIKSKKEALKLYKNNLQQKAQTYVPVTTPIVNPAPVSENPNFTNWVQKNPWYLANPNLKQEADELGSELSKTLTINNQADLIGTPAFYDVIGKHFTERYKIKNTPASKNTKSNYNVAPVTPDTTTKGNYTMADEYAKRSGKTYKKSTSLDPMHRKLALNLPYSDPNLTEAQKLEIYEKAMKVPRGNRPNLTKYSFIPKE